MYIQISTSLEAAAQRGSLKNCSENFQKIHRKTPIGESCTKV